MSEVLFEVTGDHLETGLRGYPVGYCTTSSVDPIKGLFYRGLPVSELATWAPEKVIELLLHGRKGSGGNFVQELKLRARCSGAVIKHIEGLPRQGHPTKLFCNALLILGMLEGHNDYAEDVLTVIGKLPHLVAALINYHAGWGETPHPQANLGYMENFAEMIRAPNVDKERLCDIFRLFNILHYDHGGGNLSTFVGKAIASSLEDTYGALAGAMCALAGPRHGKANQDSLEFVKEVHAAVGDSAKEADVEQFIRNRLANKKLIYGFGHAVLRAEDARATILYDYGQEHFPNHPLVQTALLLRKAGPKVLKENPKVSDPYPNVDAISGAVLAAAGFGYPEYFTVLFGLGRCVGIAAQIAYERLQARGGKGTPIVRPKYIYKPE